MDRILDEKRGQRGKEFLVRYRGYGAEEDRWLPLRDVDELEALDVWLALKEPDTLATSARQTATTTLRRRSPRVAQVLEDGRV